jgi:hypothetical protein
MTLLQQELKKQTVFSFIALLAAYATVGQDEFGSYLPTFENMLASFKLG